MSSYEISVECNTSKLKICLTTKIKKLSYKINVDTKTDMTPVSWT